MSSSELRVRVWLDGGASLEVTGVESIRENDPYAGWTTLTFAMDWADDILVEWLFRNIRGGGPESLRWTYGVNALSLAPVYQVEVI
jgi:hypothetical protein